jgi:hypothetical protein
MTEEEVKEEVKKEECCCEEHDHHHHHPTHHGHHYRSGGDLVWFLGFIGACIYYLSAAPTFWLGVLGFLKSLVWPVFLVLEAFKTLGL